MKQVIKATYFDSGEIVMYTIDEAIDKLAGYWKRNNIEQLLLEGTKLFTPYAEYEFISD